MTSTAGSVCPGCGLCAERDPIAYDGYYNTSPECWGVYTDVLGREFGDPVLFGQIHQLTVDAYAVQHPGGAHPDKSIDIHLAGLYLMLARGMAPPSVPRFLQRLASDIEEWPHFPPPARRGELTVGDVARTESRAEHADGVRRWATSAWAAWSSYHGAVADLVASHLGERS